MKRFLSHVALASLLLCSLTLAGCDLFGDDADDPQTFTQQDRLGRPAVNEVLATWANNRHAINNNAIPTEDASTIGTDIASFMTVTAGRSQAHADVLVAVLTPDVLIADLSQSGPAAFLGVETGGATGSTFGGRALTDDVVDIELGALFGTTLSDLGLVDADGNEIPPLTSDNVGPEAKNFTDTFPYLGTPR